MRGGITAVPGITAGGICAGIKRSGHTDLGMVFSKAPCVAAGTFTRNAIRAPCVEWNARLLPSSSVHAIVCNSGNANACTGARGRRDVHETARTAASALGVAAESVCVASTGVIGEFLPMHAVRCGIRLCARSLSDAGGTAFSRAIMTTDTVPKEYAVSAALGTGTVAIGGCAKGAGMIQPNMATMLAFIATDAAVSPRTLHGMLKQAVDRTFNNLTIDGDTSTNDMVLAMANGVSGVAVRSKNDRLLFGRALFDVCNNLCARIAADGEGATKRIEVAVTGGRTYADCKAAAKAIANSNLVKTAMFGNDPNWGRILSAIGYSGARFSQKNLRVALCGTLVFKAMRPVPFPKAHMRKSLRKKIVTIDVELGCGGKTCAVAHTCDFSYDYVKINAEYHT